MPIHGLTEDNRVVRGGHLRLGIMKKAANGKEYPSKIDYFSADFENKANETRFYEIYGKEPKRVTVAFAGDSLDDVFPQWYKLYGRGSGLRCRGDGVEAVRWNEKGEGEAVRCVGPKDCPFSMKHGQGGRPGCKPLASLQFFIRGLPGLQVYQINTSSVNSILNVNTALRLLKRARGGRSIAGVWVDLYLVPQESRADGKRVEIYVLKLDVPVSLDEMMQLQSSFSAPAALPQPDEAPDPLLHPGNGFQDEPVETEAEVEEEAPDQGGLDTDPEVVDAFAAAGFSEVRKRAMLASAERSGWTKEALLTAISRNGTTTTPAVTVQAQPVPHDETDDIDF